MNQEREQDEALRQEALQTFAQLNRWLTEHNPNGTYAWDAFGMVDLSFAPFFQRYCLNEHYRSFKVPETSRQDALLAHPVVRQTGLTAEKYIQYYYDYSLGYGDGQVPPGREKTHSHSIDERGPLPFEGQ